MEGCNRNAGPTSDQLLGEILGGRAWRALADLAATFSCLETDLQQAISELEAEEILAHWPDSPDGPALTLSPLAAYEHGFAIDQNGYWCQADSPEANFGGQLGGTEAEGEPEPHSFDKYVDPRAEDPGETAARRERKYRPSLRDIDLNRMRPTHILGGHVQWPVIRHGKSYLPPVLPNGEPCEGCKVRLDGQQPHSSWCEICERTDIDGLLPKWRVKSATRSDGKPLVGGTGNLPVTEKVEIR